jgi:hypothetical protein
VVDAALAPDPAERPASAERFAERLRASVAVGETTRTFGPRPVRPQPAPAAVPTRTRAAIVGLAVAAAVAVAATVATVAVVAGHRAPTVEPSAALDVAHSRPPTACAASAPLEVPAGARELHADLAGDGCGVPVVWDGRVMQVQLHGDAAPRRYDFKPLGAARRSGALLLGDWDCDGADSPAFYDPASGRIHYFALLPRTGALAPQDVASSGVEDGRAGIARTAAGCDRVVIRPAA